MTASGAPAWVGRLVVGLAGPRLHPAEARWLRVYEPAGVILFSRNCVDPGQLADLCREVHACLGVDGEIMADHEGGPVSVLAAAVGRPPAARTLGDLDDLALTRRVHAATGQRLRGVGVDRVLAPCADVLLEPNNLVIGSRAFGADPQRVAAHVQAAVVGLREGGAACCLKHWPGHGGSATDSHEAATLVGREAPSRPFRAGLDAGADALMIGHLAGVGGGDPLTLDGAALADLRREFTDRPGLLLFADDITMGGLRGALARQGVPSPDGRASGLVDPGDLSRAWLAAVAAADCDRLLVRGIPWGALPLVDGERGPGLPAVMPPPTAVAGAEAYGEVRRRAAAGIDFAALDTPVLWLDGTEGDRWGAAAAAAEWLGGRFASVTRLEIGALPVEPPSISRLLVTSHRPLAATVPAWLARGADRTGVALAAGHPSLAPALSHHLGRGWTLQALADVAREDFAAIPGMTAPREGV